MLNWKCRFSTDGRRNLRGKSRGHSARLTRQRTAFEEQVLRENDVSPRLPPCALSGLYSLTMLRDGLNQRTRHTLWVALGFLCCALIACAAIVQVGHTHPDGQTVQSDCTLCHTAHLVVQPAIPQSLPPSVLIVAALLRCSRSVPGTSLYFLSSPGLHLWMLLSLKATSNAKAQDLWRPLCQGPTVI